MKKFILVAVNLIGFGVMITFISLIFVYWYRNQELSAMEIFIARGWLLIPAAIVAYIGLWVNYYIDTKK